MRQVGDVGLLMQPDQYLGVTQGIAGDSCNRAVIMAMANWRARVSAWVGGFDATSGQRRLKGFATSRAHVNALIAASGPEMNARARWLLRNIGYAANAIESWAANTVGDGISPSSSIAQAARKDAALCSKSTKKRESLGPLIG